MARRIIHDPTYEANLVERIRAGEANHMETLLWQYLYGKPVERVAVEAGAGLMVVFRTRSEDYDPVRDRPVTLDADVLPRPALPPRSES